MTNNDDRRVPVQPLVEEVERRMRQRNVGLRLVIAPHLGSREFHTSAVQRSWYLARRNGTITLNMLDRFATVLNMRPEDLQ